ncbi:RrF2 family transcriptional regulator [Lachnoanaerobaculum umeaense]|uniref:Rrf2 family transcriptional regulator n=1 Tax=Lachnoanaerobaculum umeaense TaxID=617123 RepID=A0A385Q0R6_9FIRM|nr:Rrf2 family transcriptional regulator [Lachnoanaerobaculum umeaense]AYA99157.1 Rrf2 family transcriptional regulator [Lachnoanaerobaculum umeaense]PZW92228.1 BadM/Rrf2 family transcriptional regulator [Lachnoanaerobaculum umeaense]
MLITREMDYAVRIVRALKDGTKVSATEVARKEHLPQAITYKVLNSLLKSKLIGSMRGVNGGYYLKCDLSKTTLYDICSALGEDMSITECVRDGYDCINNRCGECILNKEFNRIQSSLNRELQKTTLDKLL